MLSRSDFFEKQVIMIGCEQLKELVLKNGNIHIKQNNETVNQISCSKIFCIFVVGDCTLTSKLIKELMSYQICMYLVSTTLKPICVIGNTLEGNYILRSNQYINSSDEDLYRAKIIVSNKIANQLILLKMIRNRNDDHNQIISRIAEIQTKIMDAADDSSLRGLEGSAAKLFFQSYFGELGWNRRSPRTREDVINFLLDVGYSYLYGYMESLLSLYGFDIYKGFYHKLFYERKSLVCDMIEPFRCLIDHTIRTGYNLKKIDEKDFKFIQGDYELDR